ncbi:MAG: magnesium transporter [Longimicrobiales bacterium]
MVAPEHPVGEPTDAAPAASDAEPTAGVATAEADTVGALMSPPIAVFEPTTTVAEAVEVIRALVRGHLVTYVFVTDTLGRLIGLITMRDLLLSGPDTRLGTIMLERPFVLKPDMPLAEAMRLTARRHYPVYPVCDGQGKLVGLVRGETLFEQQAFQISAQPGQMVGVEKEERVATPFARSFVTRHPWLQLNLIATFLAAAVVGRFQATIDSVIILAAFIPVIAGQVGNTGAQALAIAVRGLTLGDIGGSRPQRLLLKEAGLGLLNGSLVGLVAAAGMYVFASTSSPHLALQLAAVVLVAMPVGCVVAGVCGILVPLTLRRLGADPATASAILLSTATDVISIALLLGLATLVLL